jgi:RNA polymerase sigma factor (sigma-70 family)
MDEKNLLAERFEAQRPRLRAVAYRMLGTLSEAEDAVQETWLRLAGADAGAIDNLGGWLTTVVARVCLDLLRQRKSRREEPLGPQVPEPAVDADGLEREAAMAEEVGLALLVVLERLSPGERLALVLHDMFALPFEEIAAVLGRTAAAARQLASRARRRVQGATAADPGAAERRKVVEAFLSASREGNFDALLAMLDPDAAFQADAAAVRLGGAPELRGAPAVARSFVGRAQAARSALVDGAVGVVVAPRGRLLLVLRVTFGNGRIVGIDAVADPERLRDLDLAVLAA